VIIEGIEVENKESEFYASFRDRKTGVYSKLQARGYKFTLLGATWFLHRGFAEKGHKWGITEEKSGAWASGGRTRAMAIQRLRLCIARNCPDERRLVRDIKLAMKVYELEVGTNANSDRTVSR
jgi:hypothetical protein